MAFALSDRLARNTGRLYCSFAMPRAVWGLGIGVFGVEPAGSFMGP